MDCTQPGSSAHGIFQARVLEWGAISSSNACMRPYRRQSFLLIRFSFILSDSFISTILSSNSLILSSASVILLFVASRVFLISLIIMVKIKVV